MIELGKQGLSLAEMACDLGVLRQNLQNWSKQHPEFDEALKMARQYSEAFGARAGRENWGNNKFNTPLWLRFMACCHGWVEPKGDTDNDAPKPGFVVNAPKPDKKK